MIRYFLRLLLLQKRAVCRPIIVGASRASQTGSLFSYLLMLRFQQIDA